MRCQQIRKSAFLPWRTTYFLGVWKVQGKCCFFSVESDRKPIGKSGFIAILRRLSRLRRGSADSAAIAEQSLLESNEIPSDYNFHTRRKRGCDAGRMCEVS